MPSALLPRLPWSCQVSIVLAATLLLSAQLLNRSALRPVARFPWPPWMVVTPSTTSASADFCPQNGRPPRIRCDDFPLTLAAFTYGCFDPFWTLLSLASSSRTLCLVRSFCSSSPGFALRLPSHDCSHFRSCLRLAVRRVNVRRRLSLLSYRPCRAYWKNWPANYRPVKYKNRLLLL
jgi:hypothetical protein